MVGFYKGQPTDYIIKYVNGRPVREGEGLAFYYLRHNTNIIAVPTGSADASFVFNEVTQNFQVVTIQGQCAYRIANPAKAAALLNFTLDAAKKNYVSQDPQKLPQRITNIIQMQTRAEIQKRSLRETLGQSEAIAAAVLAQIREGRLLESLGVDLLHVYFLAVKPTPEVAKALEAEYRETLLRQADEAVYARRNAAVQEERKIKEQELSTDITLEQQRQSLVDLKGGNTLQEAEYRGRALVQEGEYHAQAVEREMAAYQNGDPRILLALAMRDLGQNAARVGNLNITPDLLATLLQAPGMAKAGG